MRAWSPSGGWTLSTLQGLVTGASLTQRWIQIPIFRVCSGSTDTACTSSASGWVQLDTLNQFLDWLGNAGNAGGAPAGTTVKTAAQVAKTDDTAAPTTTILCNSAPCAAQYSGPVLVSFTATDTGSGVASTHYTTDGSPVTLSSPTYSSPFWLTAPTTVNFASWDRATNANAESPHSIQIPAQVGPTIACDGTTCSASPYDGQVTISLPDASSGMTATYYTTDGSDPTTSSTQYTGPFQLLQTTTVKFFSIDGSNTTLPTQSAVVQVDPWSTVVSLTFDDATLSQYTLAYPHALAPHQLTGTFYVPTGEVNVNGNHADHMTWAQIASLASDGNELGGHTVDHVNLTQVSTQEATYQVCQGRQDLFAHGYSASSFAYPRARRTRPSSRCRRLRVHDRTEDGWPVGDEQELPVRRDDPPADAFATRTQSQTDPGPLTLNFLKADVMSAASNGGGWATIVYLKICDQALDPSNYQTCINSFHPIELSTLNNFLDWLDNIGQPSGPPAA